jgi:Zn-dependent protease
MPDIPVALAYYVVFLFSTTLHEAAHAWAAKLGGDLTAYHGGQVTLDPRPHIKREPIGMLVLPLISSLASGWPFGFASAPFDPAWALKHPKRAAWMALAGPGGNLLLVLISGLSIRFGAQLGIFHPPSSVSFGHIALASSEGFWSAAAFMLGVFFSLNLVLACFNLIPLPPLDGSAVIPLFLHDEGAKRYQHFLLTSGRGLGLVGIIVAWNLFPVIFQPVFQVFVKMLYRGVHYM